MPDALPAIELIGVTKRYGETVALESLDLRIMPGEFFCLLGPSGCGKTTTLNLIGGFIPMTAGELRIEDRVVNDLPPHKRNVNTVFQNYALFPHMTVAQNVAFGLRMEGLSSAEIATRVAEYLDLVGLGTFGDRLPAQMSGGQQQRVALARALAKRPAVLLLDEPLGALDLKLRKQMQSELARIHRQVGTTFVFVTHDQEEALSMATRIAIMSEGRVVQLGTPRDVYDQPVNRFVANFVGESNFIEGVISDRDGGPVLEAADGTVEAPRGAAAGPAAIMVRPEYLVLRTTGGDAAPTGLPGRIVNVAFMGNHTRIIVATGAGELVAIRPHGGGNPSTEEERTPGEEVRVWWPGDRGALVSA